MNTLLISSLMTLVLLVLGHFDIPPKTVDELNVDLYLGRWYQMYSSLIFNTTVEKYGYCIIADYYPTDIEAAVFGITNSQRLYGPSGKLDQVQGYAQATSDPGKLIITFNSSAGDSAQYLDPTDEDTSSDSMYTSDVAGEMRGNYWVMALGDPQSAMDKTKYPWAVVSVPFGISLFILARNVQEFRDQYESEVLALVRKRGFFLPFNKPLETYQESDCAYPPPPKNLLF